MSFSLSLFVVRFVMGLLSRSMDNYTFVELGCARAVMSFIVSAHSALGRAVFALENDQERYDYAAGWRDTCFRALRATGLDGRLLRQYLPRVIHTDFTTLGSREFIHHLRNRRVVFWANNYNGAWSRDNSVQADLERLIGVCKVGSIVVSLDRMFQSDLRWSEEAIKTDATKRDFSWTGNIDDTRDMPVVFYKYTKTRDEHLPEEDGVHRDRDEPTPKFINYPNRVHNWNF